MHWGNGTSYKSWLSPPRCSDIGAYHSTRQRHVYWIKVARWLAALEMKYLYILCHVMSAQVLRFRSHIMFKIVCNMVRVNKKIFVYLYYYYYYCCYCYYTQRGFCGRHFGYGWFHTNLVIVSANLRKIGDTSKFQSMYPTLVHTSISKCSCSCFDFFRNNIGNIIKYALLEVVLISFSEVTSMDQNRPKGD